MNVNCLRDPLTCKCDYHLGLDDRRFEYACPKCGEHTVSYGPLRDRDTCARAAKMAVEAYRTKYPDFAALWTTDAMYASRARWNARLAARPCCRAHGTTCPACRAKPSRLRDLLDLLRIWWHHG